MVLSQKSFVPQNESIADEASAGVTGWVPVGDPTHWTTVSARTREKVATKSVRDARVYIMNNDKDKYLRKIPK